MGFGGSFSGPTIPAPTPPPPPPPPGNSAQDVAIANAVKATQQMRKRRDRSSLLIDPAAPGTPGGGSGVSIPPI